jgi:hypothetical protein
LKLGVLLADEGLYNVLRGKAVQYVYDDEVWFCPFVAFCIVQNNVQLHINTRADYSM